MALFASVGSVSAEVTLNIGDAAPALKPGKWVQGEPVTAFDSDKVYVVEFWATWCGPCRATIPHLDELHEAWKDKGVVFIGQDVWERDEKLVEPFVKEMGEKMSYRVAMDDKTEEKRGYMAVNWMQAAGQNGIPSAFVVGKDGKIAWIGHPSGLNGEILEQVVAGKFDVAKAKEAKAKEAEGRSKMQAHMQVINEAAKEKDWDRVTAELDAMEKEDPSMGERLAGMRLRVAVDKGDGEGAVKQAGRVEASAMGKSPQGLAMIARQLTGLKEPSKEVVEKAVALSGKAMEATSGDDPMVLESAARVQFIAGNKDEAVKLAEKAVSRAPDRVKPTMERTLKALQDGKLPDGP